MVTFFCSFEQAQEDYTLCLTKIPKCPPAFFTDRDEKDKNKHVTETTKQQAEAQVEGLLKEMHRLRHEVSEQSQVVDTQIFLWVEGFNGFQGGASVFFF